MSAKQLTIIGVILVLLLAAGWWAYEAVLGETETASGPIIAPTLALAAEATQVPPTATTAAPTETTAPEQPAPTEAAPAAPAETQPAQAAAELPATGPTVYKIVQDESEARFNIFEELQGSPKDVIGVTNQVAGEASVDLSNLSATQVGEILINARTLATDDNRRNGAIRNRILFTDQYEYISFKPTAITGLEGTAAPGQSFTFQIAGDLTIRDVTMPAVFDVIVTVEAPDRLVGSAQSSINRADFGINIPNVPFVANVGESVALEIDFVLAP